MTTTVELDGAMNRFRVASRELFNNYFRVPDPYNNGGWEWEERYSVVEEILFQKLVVEPGSLKRVPYRDLQPEVGVELRGSDFAPLMINRGVDTGYWDDPTTEITKDARLLFLCFFDWDQLSYRDNRYVRVQIQRWDAHETLVGRQALIESQYVRFLRI
jgi:hypothetical protein